MKNKKILLVSPYSATKVGGIGTWSKNILEYIHCNDFKDFKFQNTAIWFKKNIYKNHFLQVAVSILDSFWILFKLCYNLCVFNPDVIHYTSSAGNALLKDRVAIVIAHIFKSKFVIHFRFGRISELSLLKNIEWKRLKHVISRSDAVIVIDIESYDTLLKEGFSNIFYVPNPISSQIEKIAMEKDKSKIKRGKVVFVGHVVRAKGIYELVQSCSKISKVKELIVLGPVRSETKRDLKKIADFRNNGNWLFFKGEVKREEVIKELKGANIMCLPSYTEGFPNAVLEAMSLGCPIISTKVGAIPEMLNDGAGICVLPRSIEELQSAIDFLLNNEKDALMMGEKAKQRVLSEYTLDKIFDEYKNIWCK